jgi:2-polyprenyl-3-methyl-5-hydroxy-6-metoxy-1,4-benzoquinol methylase
VRLTEQRYWEEKALAAGDEEPGFMFFEEIARHLPPGRGLSFLEIGCAPGRILAEFGRRLGYEVHGVDYAADAAALERYLREHGCKVGDVVREDVFDWDPGRTYDVVTSFGVIEHFDDPRPLIDRHFELAAPGGRVVIGLPNFARGQHALHWLFDRPNLRRHNLRCMNLGYLREAAARNGAGVVELRYTGGHYDFWPEVTRSARLGVEEDDPRVRASPLSAVHLALRDRARRRPEQGNPLFSPYILGIFSARRLAR